MKYEYYGTNGSGIDWRIIALIIAGAILFFTHTCRSPQGTKTITRTVTDTVHTSSTDTIWETKIKYITLEIPKPDTIYIIDSIAPDGTVVHYMNYNLTYIDSLLEAGFKVVVDGKLISHDFNYKALIPKYIHTKDTFRINTTKTEVQNKRELFIGIEVGGTETSFNLSPSLTFKGKNNFLYTYRYDLFQKSHNLGVQKLIKFK